MLKKIFTYLTFTILFFSAKTQEIKGRIISQEGRPLPYTNIQLLPEKKAFVTDSNGYFYIKTSDQTQKITFSYVGFTPQTITKEQFKKYLKITLIPTQFKDVIIEDDGLVQEMEKVDLPPTLRPSVSGGDITDLLNTSLGVNKSNELSSSYSVRGGNYDENLVYVNGMEVYRPFLARSGQQEGLSFANPNMVENIAFSAGGFDAKYGDKMSSVLDITYKRPEEFGASLMLSMLGASGHIQGVSKNNKFSYLGGIRWRTNQYVLNSLNTQGDYKPNFVDIQTLFNYKVNKKIDIDFLANYSLNDYKFIPQTRETEFGTFNQAMRLKVYFEGQEINKFEAFTGALALNYKPKETLKLNFSLSGYKTYETQDHDILGEYWLSDIETDLGSEDAGESINQRGVGSYLSHSRNYLDGWIGSFNHLGSSFNIKKNLTISHDWGFNYKYETIEGEYKEWEQLDSAGYNIPGNADSIGYTTPQPYQYLTLDKSFRGQNNIENHRFQTFYQNTLKWKIKNLKKEANEFINLKVGLRAHYWTFSNRLLLSPRVSLVYQPAIFKKKIKNDQKVKIDTLIKQNISFKLSGGVYQQPPFYREYLNPDGSFNPDVIEQTSYHALVGMTYDFNWGSTPFKFITEAYFKYMTNVNPYRIDNVLIQYDANNNAIAHAEGIDMKLHGEFANGIESWVSLSAMQIKEDLKDDFYYEYYNENGEIVGPENRFDPITDSSIIYPGWIPKPTDRNFKVALYFQDEMPKLEQLKFHLSFTLITPFPFGPKDGQRYQDVFRSTPYKRADVGISYDLMPRDENKRNKGFWKPFKAFDIAFDIFNIIASDNPSSYYWVTDVSGVNYAIPNYLTGRRVNFKINMKF